MCFEVSILLTDILEIASAWISDLNIAGQVLLSVGLGELAEGLVSDRRDVELVISNSQKIVVQLLEDGI